MRVLVVDDDETIRALVIMLFAKRGDIAVGAADGEEAIARLDAESFDLLILDLMMPRTDGAGVLSHLAARSGPAPRVILMTAAAPSMAKSVPREQVVAVIPKPFDIKTLLAVADQAVADRA